MSVKNEHELDIYAKYYYKESGTLPNIYRENTYMAARSRRGFSTRSLHTDIPYLQPSTHIMPPFLTSTYATELLDVPTDQEFSFKYPRIAHPNGILLEHTLTSLEEGEAAVAVADGMRAISIACTSMLYPQPSGSVISTTPLYSDTYSFFMQDLPMLGKQCFFLNANNSPEDQLHAYITHAHLGEIPLIELLFIETPANPTLTVFDIKKLSSIAHTGGIRVIVDNTFATPYNQRPLLLGADICIESLTKYCCGNGTTLGGAIIGSKPFIDHMRNRMKREGGHLNPFAAWLIQLGLQTFALRMSIHNRNAFLLALFLSSEKNKKKITTVYYPGLISHPGHTTAKNQMRTPYGKLGFGGMVSFELARPEWIKPFTEYLAKETFVELAVSLGSTSSTCSVPAQQIHGGLSPQEREALGIRDTLIRFSVGIEDIHDIKRALISALNHIQ